MLLASTLAIIVINDLGDKGAPSTRIIEPKAPGRVSVNQTQPLEKNKAATAYEMLSKNYESEIREPLLNLMKVPRFAREASILAASLDEFTASGTNSLSSDEMRSFSESLKKSQELIRQHKAFIEDYFRRIQMSFEDKDLDDFTLFLSDLERIAANEERLRYWKNLSEKIPLYFEAFKAASKYKIEGDSRNEMQSLQKIEGLGFSSSAVAARISELTSAIEDLDFSDAISTTIRSLEENDLQGAYSHVQIALSIKSSDTKAVALKERVLSEIRREQSILFIKRGQQLAEGDNWENASELFSKALELAPFSHEAKEGLESSMTVMAYKAIFEDFVDRPIRLADKEVRFYASESLTEAEHLSSASKSLANLMLETKKLLAKVSPVKIRIKSDGKARIRVRGIGFIEPTTDRYVELMPGEYEFFAECIGKRTRMYEVDILPTGPLTEHWIECGESI